MKTWHANQYLYVFIKNTFRYLIISPIIFFFYPGNGSSIWNSTYFCINKRKYIIMTFLPWVMIASVFISLEEIVENKSRTLLLASWSWLEFCPEHKICARTFFKWGRLSSLGAVIGGTTHAKCKFVRDISIVRNSFRELILILMVQRTSACMLGYSERNHESIHSNYVFSFIFWTQGRCVYARVCVCSLACVCIWPGCLNV